MSFVSSHKLFTQKKCFARLNIMEFLEVPLFDDDVIKLLVRLGIDLFFLTLIVVFAILPRQREREFAFTVVMLNMVVFFICFTMKKLELDLGLALGLFAVFGVLRYRTDAIRLQEMTYLFIVIGIAVINSLANKKTSYAEVVLVNSMILAAVVAHEWVLGRALKKRVEAEALDIERTKTKKSNSDADKSPKYTIEYDRLEWLGPSHRQALIHDLLTRTGMEVTKVDIKSIDLVQNRATLTIWTAGKRLRE